MPRSRGSTEWTSSRFRVAEIVFLPFAVRAQVFRGHQSRIATVAGRIEPFETVTH
jgi:hypothetical protein